MIERVKTTAAEFLLILIITVPAFYNLINTGYFSMHDDQHIARLYLLDQGIKQGNLYPRWVDTLGFGYGYPLFNFYPPAIYYISEFFHSLGFSYIWSIKLLLILGFILGAWGIYLLQKKLTNKATAFLSSILFTYFTYKAVLVYVRGAFAEFFAISLFPFLVLSLYNLSRSTNFKKSLIFASCLAAVTLAHFIALASLFYLGIFFFFFLAATDEKKSFTLYTLVGLIIGLSLSSFYWLPSLVERSFTLVNNISITELFNYKLHYIYPQQFWYSAWGYGGSVAGPYDGMTFQLGKIYIFLILTSLVLSIFYFAKIKKLDTHLKFFILFIFLFAASLFMTTQYSSIIWDGASFLHYLQFPWRFLSFVAFFISITASYSIFFLNNLLPKTYKTILTGKKIAIFLVATSGILTIFIYSKYFHPQTYVSTTDRQRTSYQEIAWNVSRTSIDFIPKGVKTKKSYLNNTIIDIDQSKLPRYPFEILAGSANVQIIQNKFRVKKFKLDAGTNSTFRLNTYNFPGWQAYLNGGKILINDNNDYKLITVKVPKGKSELVFKFENTFVRNLANFISITGVGLAVLFFIFKFKKIDG